MAHFTYIGVRKFRLMRVLEIIAKHLRIPLIAEIMNHLNYVICKLVSVLQEGNFLGRKQV